MNFDETWLNRLGIILNFLAGFMLAPELIGIERLKKIELFLERVLLHVKSTLDTQLRRGNEKAGLIHILRPASVIITLVLIIWSLQARYYFITFIAVLLIYFFLVSVGFALIQLNEFILEVVKVFATFGFYSPRPIRLSRWNVIRRYHFLLLTWYPLLAIVPAIANLTIEPILLAINMIVSKSVRRLEGEERLRSMIVASGIVFFIVGNFLQLLATF